MYHGLSVFVPENHEKFNAGVKRSLSKVVTFTNPSNPVPTSADIKEVKTLTGDIKVLLEEHNKIVSFYEKQLEDLHNRLSKLEIQQDDEKKDVVSDLIDLVQKEITAVKTPLTSPRVSPAPSPRVSPKSAMRKLITPRLSKH